jgi:hypothetical protein
VESYGLVSARASAQVCRVLAARDAVAVGAGWVRVGGSRVGYVVALGLVVAPAMRSRRDLPDRSECTRPGDHQVHYCRICHGCPPIGHHGAMRRGPVRGALIGLAVGALLVVLIVVLPAALQGDFYEITDPLVVMGIPLLVLGAAVGAVVGGRLRSDR